MNPKPILAELSKCLIARILEATSSIPNATLEGLSLAGLLNLLFLYRGSYGSIGDYVTTQRTLRHLVGEDLYWRWPDVTTVELPENAPVN